MRHARGLAAFVVIAACASCGGGAGVGGKGGSSGSSGSGGSASGGTVGTGGATAGSGGSTAGGAFGGGGTGAGGAGGTGAAAGDGGGSGSAAGAGGSAAGSGGRGGGAGGTAGATAGRGGATAGNGGRGLGGSAGAGGAQAGQGGAAGRGGNAGSTTADAGSDVPNAFNPCPPAGTACIIMPLGDSITYGVGSSGSGGGYRVPLFQTAVTANQTITFVGTQMNGPTTVAGKPFPQRHEGHSGYTIDDDTIDMRSGISPLVDASIAMFHPHIVLLMIGTNDVHLKYMLSNAPTRLGNLIDQITGDAPDALVVLARLTPTQDDTVNTDAQTYNSAMTGLVQTRAAAGKHVVLVDMYAAFSANASYKTALMYDMLHPNDAGYSVMAQTWYAAIRDYLR